MTYCCYIWQVTNATVMNTKHFFPIAIVGFLAIVGCSKNDIPKNLIPPRVDYSRSKVTNNHIETIGKVIPGGYQIVGAALQYNQAGPSNNYRSYDTSNCELMNPKTASGTWQESDKTLHYVFTDDDMNGLAGHNEPSDNWKKYLITYRWIVRYKLPEGNDVAESPSILYTTTYIRADSTPNFDMGIICSGGPH